MDNNAVVLGWGTVGKGTALAFGINKYFSRSEANITLEDAAKCKYIFVCLPTPVVDGKYFTQDIYEIIKQINQYPNTVDRVFILRSTVYPGFTRHISESLGIEAVVFNPEFLSEDTASEDAVKPQLIVIGNDNPKYGEEIEALYKGRFKYPDPIITDTVTAEMIKLSLNNFFSLKVAYANEVFDCAQKIGANYEAIKAVLESHPWGSKNHFTVFYKNKRGIHGKCLPKDLDAFTEITQSILLKAVQEIKKRNI